MMFLSDRDIKWAIDSKKLFVDPPPSDYDENSIDLHLDDIEHAKVWDAAKMQEEQSRAQRKLGIAGASDRLALGNFDYNQFAATCLIPIPMLQSANEVGDRLVFRLGSEVVIKPLGFLLWTTKEVIGTEKNNPELISFVNAKSTKARVGIMVHFTAPTINSGWQGKVTLEIINLGPFTFSLKPNDAIAQLTVATISSRPDPTLRTRKKGSSTHGQIDPEGLASS